MSIVAVVGLGYVGLPLAVEFGKKFETIGFDLSEDFCADYEDSVIPRARWDMLVGLGLEVDYVFEDDAEEPISAAMFMDNDDGLDLDSRHAMKGWDIESSEHGHEKAHEEELVWNLAPQKVAARS